MNGMAFVRGAHANLRARWYFRSAEFLGSRVRVWGRPIVRNSGRLRIGERARFAATMVPLELAVGASGLLEIGESTFVNYGTSIAALQSVRIGSHCSIGTYVIIMDNDFHRLEPERRNELPDSKPIVIEDNVWLGGRAIVLGGVTIGEGSVVGAGSVVTRDVPPRSVVTGVPAKIVRQL
jgi:maltose O-acetyltransferase